MQKSRLMWLTDQENNRNPWLQNPLISEHNPEDTENVILFKLFEGEKATKTLWRNFSATLADCVFVSCKNQFLVQFRKFVTFSVEFAGIWNNNKTCYTFNHKLKKSHS